MLHFMAPKPGGPTALPRDNMCAEAKYFLEQYDELPLRPNSKELAKARIRMVREMRLTGWYNTEVQKGLEVTRHEVSQAMLGLRLNTFEGVVTHGYQKLELPEDAHFYKAKVIEWKGRETWVGVRDHELPLRLGRNESNPPPPLTAINLQLHNLRESPDMEDQDMDSGSDEHESDGQDSGSEEDESHGKGSESDEDFDTWAWRIVSMTEEEFLKYNAFPAV